MGVDEDVDPPDDYFDATSASGFTIFMETRPPNLDGLEEDWVLVEGPALDWPVYLRIATDGRGLRVVGMVIDSRGEVTTRGLRKLKIGEIVRQLGHQLHPAEDPVAYGLLDQWRRDLPVVSRPRPGGGTPPTDDDFRQFAKAYAARLQLGRRGAVTDSARAVGIDRSTAHRWIRQCRERGYLPPREQS